MLPQPFMIFNAMQNALQVIGFKDGQRIDIKSVLAGILQLGNVKFMNAGGAQVVDMEGKGHSHVTVDDVIAASCFTFVSMS